MRITTYSPVRTMAGTHKGSDLVYFEKNDRTFARFRAEIHNPQSVEQVLIRTYLTIATRNWSNLTEAQRDGWREYAELYFYTDDDGNRITPSGIATYLKANSVRQVLGLALTSDAPTEAPPVPLTAMEESDTAADELGLVLTHSYSSLVGFQVIVRATPAMASVAAAPRPTDLRYVKGVSPASATALVTSGTPVLFEGIRYPVEAGERFGVEARIVRTADGIMSRPLSVDWIKGV